MKVTLDVWDLEEHNIVSEAVRQLLELRESHRRLGGSDEPGGPCPATLADCVAIGARIVDLPGAALPIAVVETPAPAEVSVEDVNVALQAAARRGVATSVFVTFLTDKGVKRVPELSAEGRAEFLAFLAAQNVGKAV